MRAALPILAAKYKRPRLAQHIISRPDILQRLHEALLYPLTLVRAGAGYGKSTLINQAFPEEFAPIAWLSLSEQESAPIPFVQHLIYAIQGVCPSAGTKSLQMLTWDDRQGNPDPFAVMEALLRELTEMIDNRLLIIFDDYQYVAQAADIIKLTDFLIDLLPEQFHLVIASREKIPIPGLALKRAKGLVLEIGEEELAFKQHEIQSLFRQNYGLKIEDTLAAELVRRTEGWIMAIHMLGQMMKKGQSWKNAFSSLPQSMTELYEYLLQDYLKKQPEVIRRFLHYTAYLHILRAEDCDHILDIDNSAAILRDLETKGLFTFNIGEGLYRYHHLFQEYLQRTAAISRSELNDFHYRAAAYYRQSEFYSQAVEHLLEAGFYREAGLLIKDIYKHELANGRQSDLERWLDLIPAEVLNGIPELLLCRGDIFRLTGDFTSATMFYSQAENGFAASGNLTGKYLVAKAFAMVYLDTVQPVLAEQYLAKALEYVDLSGIQEKARVYQLMAENNINLGHSREAAALFQQANELFMEDSRGDVEARMHLRTGRLTTAKNILIRQAKRGHPYQLPKSHRETPLLLSLINAFMGDIDAAWANAQEGLNIGRSLKAVFVEAVGYMRLGHANQLKSWTSMDEALECYQQALDITSGLNVERGKAEPLFGLCLVYGHQGNLDSALRYGLEGLRVSKQAKDDWIAAINELALAIAYYKAGDVGKAEEWVSRALESFTRCGDSYLSTAAILWQAIILLERGRTTLFRETMERLLLLAQTHDYDFIFSKPTLLGLRDIQAVMPLLLAAQQENICQAYTGSLLSELGGSAELVSHPGYTLRVQTLGQFKVWRGMDEIRPKEWQREKAKRLFQYFITNRRQLVHKEQLIEALWGDSGSDSDFKVALNAMTNALEPARNARSAPFYLSKHNSAYGLNLATGILLDADEFESYIVRGNRIFSKDPEQAIKLYRLALNLYKGDYLPDCCYEDWSLEERERLLMLYITTAERMAVMLFERGETEECITLAMRIIGKDHCWEEAYRLLMKAYHRQNNRAMVTRVFQQCRHNLKNELGVLPAEETINLYEKLTAVASKF